MTNKYNEGTYEGMFESLKHNILLMLNQIEGNAEYSKLDINVYLEVIEKRIKDIKLFQRKDVKVK